MALPDGSSIEPATFAERRDRTAWVARRFAPYLKGSVLDVGCYEAPLREMLDGVRYVGVDVAGRPDVRLDLDRGEPLPFDDRSFETVICIEVLEHLDHLHQMFDELVRIAAGHVIVSLPNCWRDARRPIERGRGRFAHYGLPAQKPLDRHKWFFSYEDAVEFTRANCARHGLDLREMFATEMHRGGLVRTLRHLRYPGLRYLNRYAQTMWAVMAKPPPRG